MHEETRKREHGFPNTLEVSALTDKGKRGCGSEFTVEGTVLHDGTPRVLQIGGIPVEAQLEGTIFYLRNRDEPGVIGQVGSTLGKHGVNIATFALGRRDETLKAPRRFRWCDSMATCRSPSWSRSAGFQQ